VLTKDKIIIAFAGGLALGMFSSSAMAQDRGPVRGGENAYEPQKSLSEQLTGTWKLVSIVDVFDDGERRLSWGPEVGGMLHLDGHGHVMAVISAQTRSRARLKLLQGQNVRLLLILGPTQ
jgi:Lipocalin-like domain